MRLGVITIRLFARSSRNLPRKLTPPQLTYQTGPSSAEHAPIVHQFWKNVSQNNLDWAGSERTHCSMISNEALGASLANYLRTYLFRRLNPRAITIAAAASAVLIFAPLKPLLGPTS